jgi:NAD(P)-dependent dehydrogenase (short-subunit alcohol dehydrogenase family)
MKSVIVTGGGGGIGGAICRTFSAAGYRVGVFDLEPAARSGAAALKNAVPLPGDVTDEASAAAAVKAFGETPDCLINAAGIVRKTPVLEHSVANFRRVLEVNLVGAFIVSQIVAREMVKRRSGVIINISSIGSLTAATMCGAYGPAKAGLTNLTKLFAVELAETGVRCNAVAPGMIATGMGEIVNHDANIRAVRQRALPTGQFGTGEDVAKTCLFLASDDARYINGEQIVVDAALTVSVISGASMRVD